MALDRGPRDPEGSCRPGALQLPAALPQDVLEKCVEAVDVAEGEKALDFPREEGVRIKRSHVRVVPGALWNQYLALYL